MPTPKSIRFIFKITPAQNWALKEAAERADITASEYIRQAVEAAIKRDARKMAQKEEQAR